MSLATIQALVDFAPHLYTASQVDAAWHIERRPGSFSPSFGRKNWLQITADACKLRLTSPKKRQAPITIPWADRPQAISFGRTMEIVGDTDTKPLWLQQLGSDTEAQALCQAINALAVLCGGKAIRPLQRTLLPIMGLTPGVSGSADVWRFGRQQGQSAVQMERDGRYRLTAVDGTSCWATVRGEIVTALHFYRQDTLPSHWQMLGLHRALSVAQWRRLLPQHHFSFDTMTQTSPNRWMLVFRQKEAAVPLRIKLCFRWGKESGDDAPDLFHALIIEQSV